MLRAKMAAGVLCVFGLYRLDVVRAQDAGPVSGIVVDADSIKTGDPKGALWRSALLPGWGQAYN
ncbi:MAG: hypothetical protein ACC655_08375, partial [Rhodothermia bacterium]